MSREQIEERIELSDIIDYAMRDWDNYIDECREEDIPPIDTFEEWIADAVLRNGYRKQTKAEWIICSDGYYPYCSVCKNEPKNGVMTDYCPSCGAEMSGGKE